MGIYKVWRSAVTGQYVSKEFALKNPETTVMETTEFPAVDVMPEGFMEPHEPLVLWYPLGEHV